MGFQKLDHIFKKRSTELIGSKVEREHKKYATSRMMTKCELGRDGIAAFLEKTTVIIKG